MQEAGLRVGRRLEAVGLVEDAVEEGVCGGGASGGVGEEERGVGGGGCGGVVAGCGGLVGGGGRGRVSADDFVPEGLVRGVVAGERRGLVGGTGGAVRGGRGEGGGGGVRGVGGCGGRGREVADSGGGRVAG